MDTPTTTATFFNIPNIIIIAGYFVAMLMMGGYFAKKTDGTAAYFLGGRKIPSWAIGFSMLSTSMSSITFLAMPASAFALDWRLLVPNMTVPIVGIIAMWLFVPFFRNNAQVSAFEYLNMRYGSGVRLYASIVFLLLQTARMGAILYLLVIPLQMITGVDSFWIIVITGGAAAIYTLMGGMAASIWTDVVQGIALYIGGLAAIIVIVMAVPGGLDAIVQLAIDHDKFSLGPMKWDPSERTFWTLLSVGIVAATNGYTSDQNMVQRYLAASSTREARKATFISAVLSLPTWMLFFFIGTCLYGFYQFLPDATVAGLPNDAVFPYFILTEMPMGLSGLVIAGVLSAAMGTLSSSLNAFSTVLTTDIFKAYLVRDRSDKFYTSMARWFTAVAALAMFAVSFVLLRSDGEGILDFNLKVSGLLHGVVVCFYLLGFFAPQVNRKIIWQGFAVAFSLNLYLVLVQWKVIPNILHLNIHPYWVYPFVVGVMIILCLVLAFVQRAQPDPGMHQLTQKELKARQEKYKKRP